ncbi:MAG: SDR family NAD(P)-dependent oxidoreductase, partial [Planctomycetota bacterium]|nr:SDR family NAD(P)-dependent oxidoreductase [Planctomycetota bacterium]
VRQRGGEAIAISCDAADATAVAKARAEGLRHFGGVDILVNGAGANQKSATTGGVTAADAASPTFWDLEPEAVRKVFDLNFLGTFLAVQVFGNVMAKRGR